MVSKNNQWQHLQASAQRLPHYGLRKLSVGVASVLLSTTLYMGVNAHADTVATPSETATPAAAVSTLGSSGTEMTGDAAGSSVSGLPASSANSVSEVPTSQGSPANSVTTQEKPVDSVAGVKADSEVPAQPVTPNASGNNTGDDETTESATMTWTIHYVDENGNKLAPDTVVSHDYQRTDSALKTGTFEMGDYKYVDGSLKVTGTNNTGYHIDAPDFKYNQTLNGKLFDMATWQVAALKFDGYHVDHDSLVVSDYLTKDPGSLGSTSHDYSGGEFTFHYALNPKTVTINYVNDDDNEKVVGTGTVSGKPNTVVTITPNLPSGYMLTPGKDVPGTYTVTDGDNQAVTIHVQKQFVDVSATDPQAKQTRTITLHYVYAGGLKDGQPAFDDAVLDVYYHRTATLDRATNQTTYGDWTWDQSQGDTATPGYHVVSGKWTNLPQSWATVTADVPSVKGYHADLAQNDPANTNHVPANTWVFPTYNNGASAGQGATAYLDGHGYEVSPTHTVKYVSNKTTVTVNYVDDDNNGINVGSQHWDGTIGQHIDLTLTPPANYVLSPGWVNPSSYDFDGVNSSWYTVHVKHATQDVTDQEPKDRVTKVTRLTRNHLYGNGPHKGEKFAESDIFDVAWKRTAIKDLVTNQVTFGDWQIDWDDSKSVQGQLTARPTPYMGINGMLYPGKNGYSYLGDNSHSEFVCADGSVKVNVWNKYGWQGAAELEAYPVLNYYYGRGQVKISVEYVDFDTNQRLGTKELTGDDYLDGNTITFNKSDLTDWSAGIRNLWGSIIHLDSEYQLYADQTLPTTYKIDTVSHNGNLAPITVYVVKPRTVQFTFVDNDSTVNAQHPQVGDAVSVTGITGSTTPVSMTVPAGYKLATGQQLPTTYTFTKGETKQAIALVHQHVTVQPDAPKTTTDALPDNLSKTYPSGVSESDLNKTVTRTININKPDGSKDIEVQSVKLTRTADVDEVTGAVKYGDWTTGEWPVYNAPVVPGYTPSQANVAKTTVTGTTEDQTVKITYTANPQSTTVNYVDQNGKIIHTTLLKGVTDQTVTVPNEVPDGWVTYNSNMPTRIVMGSSPAYIDYLIAHRLAFVRSTDGVKAGDLIPGTKMKTFNDRVHADNLVTHAAYTINIWADEAHTRKLATKTYHTDFIRNAVVDAVTGEVYYYNWSEGGKHVFAGFTRPAGDGYQAVVVPSWTATQADPTKTVDLVARPQQVSGTIQYQTADGTVVARQTFTGNTAVTLTAPKGYTLMTEDAVVMPTLDKHQTYVVYVRPTQTLYTAADQLPDGMESLIKTLTRTIHITEANGHVRTITQRVRFTRTATVKVDGSIVYSDWQATGRAVWNKVFLPKRHGYHLAIDGLLGKIDVMGDMSNALVNVKYVKD